MRRRILAAIVCVVLLLSLVACGGDTAGETKGQVNFPEGTFLAGFGRANFTPATNVIMHANQKMSTGVHTWLYADTIAVTGTNGQTALIITVDIQNVLDAMLEEARAALSKEHDIPKEQILISATHTHNSPELTVGNSVPKLVLDGIYESARAAIQNQAPAEMYTAIIKTENMNFDRNYLMEDGTYAGTNFGDVNAGTIKRHETEADPYLQLIKFVRQGQTTRDGQPAKDIIISNFCAHPHRDYNTATNVSLISANVPFFFREELEKEADCHVAYYTGASGNVNMNSRIEEENVTVDMKDQGRRLAQYAIRAGENYTKVEGGAVYGVESFVTATVDHSRDHLAAVATQTQNIASTKGTDEAQKFALENGLLHQQEAKGILKKVQKGETMDVPVGALSIGDVAFVAATYEMYHTTGSNIKKASPFDMTFVLYLCNGNYGYMPEEECFDHGGYGVYSCQYVRGTAEILGNKYSELLNELSSKY